MKNTVLVLLLLIPLFWSCRKSDDIDQETPQIDLNYINTFPNNCDTLYCGEDFVLDMIFRDNYALSSFSIDIHNNFDHHSHSTEIENCNLDEVKEPTFPYTFIEEYKIPNNLKEYHIQKVINIPMANDSSYYDSGDYHFYIKVTDNSGWSCSKGLSVKILYRQNATIN